MKIMKRSATKSTRNLAMFTGIFAIYGVLYSMLNIIIGKDNDIVGTAFIYLLLALIAALQIHFIMEKW